MMNTELIQNAPQPVLAALDGMDETLDFEREAEDAREERGERPARRTAPKDKGLSKKDQVLEMYKGGVEDVLEIARRVGARTSYVAQVLQQAGLLDGYFDLYTSTGKEQNIYSRFFRNVLSFKSVEAARESVTRIDSLYRFFEELGDRAGQHHAMVLALMGKNRARWSGKLDEAQVFSDWLAAH
jgi:hypothetical protein